MENTHTAVDNGYETSKHVSKESKQELKVCVRPPTLRFTEANIAGIVGSVVFHRSIAWVS